MNPKSGSLRGAAVRGVTVIFAASLAAKLVGLATIYFTGILLTKSDFALYAIAIAWGEIFGFLQNGGLHRFLLQRAKSFDALYPSILGLSLAINGLWFFVLLALAPVIAEVYDAEGVTLLIVLFGLSLPMRTMALLLRSHLLIQLRFTEISVLDIYSALIRNGGVILLAIAGFGPMSFVLPVIVVGLFESIYLAGKRPGSWRPLLPRRRLLRALAAPAFWIMVSLLAASLVANGDYLVIGALTDKAIIGAYFFGFQLTVAVLNMFAQSLRSVFLPSFVALGGDRPRQEAAFLRSLEMGSLLLLFILFAVAAVAEPVIAWLWSGKWNAAIPVVEIIAVASLARVVSPIARWLLEARGAWRTIAGLSWVEGLGLMASAAIGALLGDLFTIAVAVGAYMTLVGILYIAVICRYTAYSAATVGRAVFGPYAIATIALGTAWLLAAIFVPSSAAFVQAIVRGAVFTASFAVLVLLFKRDMLAAILDVARQRWSR